MFGAKIIDRKIEYVTGNEASLAKEGYFTHKSKAVLTAFMEDELRGQKILFLDLHRGEDPKLEREIFGREIAESDSFGVAFDGEEFWYYAGSKEDLAKIGLSVFPTAMEAFSYGSTLRMNFYQSDLFSKEGLTDEQKAVIDYYVRGTLDEIEAVPVEEDNDTEIVW